MTIEEAIIIFNKDIRTKTATFNNVYKCSNGKYYYKNGYIYGLNNKNNVILCSKSKKIDDEIK